MTDRANAVEDYGSRPWAGLEEVGSGIGTTRRPQVPLAGLVLPWLVAAAAFVFVLFVVAHNAHQPLGISPGPLAQVLALTAPYVAAGVAALAVLSPWRGYLAVLVLTPYWDAAQVSWQVGEVQVIAQSLFVVALGAGALLGMVSGSTIGPREWLERARSWRAGAPRASQPPPLWVVGVGAGLVLAAIACLSTAASPDRFASLLVLLHGVLEPMALGSLLLLFRLDRRRLWTVAIALGLSVGLGAFLNLAQTLPDFRTLSLLQERRIVFSRLTYFNVGLFGELLAMAVPLLVGALAARRAMGLGQRTTAAVITALAAAVLALFLTFSKSAWIATAGGTLVLLLLLSGSWRRRAGVLAGAVAASVALVPWPAYLLKPVLPAVANLDAQIMTAVMGVARFNSWDPSTIAGEHSIVPRLTAGLAGLRMAFDHPLLGVGLDQFGPNYLGPYRPSGSFVALDSAHSFWPEIAAELGLVALAVAVVIYAVAGLSAWRVYRRPPDASLRALAATLLAGLASWLIVATAYAGDMYRPWRNMASDFVLMAVLVAAALGLQRIANASRAPAQSGAPDAG